MATWPASLPESFNVQGYQEKATDLLVKTKMDQGPDKIRRWGTAGVTSISGQMVFTDAQMTTFETFYITTIVNGSLSFTWTHPRTASSESFRFTDQPTYQPTGGGEWSVSLKMEILP